MFLYGFLLYYTLGRVDFDAEVASIERELGGGEESPEKEIQSLTGKLGQALRQGEDQDLVDTELTKYVVNSVFSALNLAELTDEDKLDIIKKCYSNLVPCTKAHTGADDIINSMCVVSAGGGGQYMKVTLNPAHVISIYCIPS